MTQIHHNVLTPDEIQTLLDWFNSNDRLVDDRLDVRSKTPDWNSDTWPRHLVKKVLDQVLTDPYRVEVVLFYGSRISFKLHTDSGNGDGEPLYKNVIIPLLVEGPATTVIFDNYWSGPHTRFGKTPQSPFVYSLPDRHGNLQHIADIRILLKQCCEHPHTVDAFVVDDEFINNLRRLVDIRSGQQGRVPDGFQTDYTNVTNYDPSLQFDAKLHEQYLSHVPIENLHGLTLDTVAEWHPGQAITFDRGQLHCAGNGHKFKIGISIFTYRY